MTQIPSHPEGEAQRAPAGPAQTIPMPSPTVWPLVLAFGLTLVAAGLVTTLAVSVLGLLLGVWGAVGWFREVLPAESHASVAVRAEVIEIATSRREVERIAVVPELTHPRIPIEIYPIRAGILGGLVGGLAMAAVAMAYGWIYHGSIWYPVNLLGAVVYSHAAQLSPSVLLRFSLILFGVALLIHLAVSLLVGLLYGTMLPMLPRRPILLGGLIAPLFWSGLVHGVLGIVNPLLDQRINWLWFVASQIAFGYVAGLVVVRHARVRVRQVSPLAVRAGIEATGLPGRRQDGEEKR
ncbi:MAG TPA: hypothetical protein VNJ52_05555 [Patescibacteria group bacterium]|nr:hypothetical protein [Patescibacteria group bacterium]